MHKRLGYSRASCLQFIKAIRQAQCKYLLYAALRVFQEKILFRLFRVSLKPRTRNVHGPLFFMGYVQAARGDSKPHILLPKEYAI